MSVNIMAAPSRRFGRIAAALALSAGLTAAATAAVPTAAHAATCRPTTIDGNWYSTDPNAYITRISVQNLSCTTGGSGYAVHTWAHHWLGIGGPGESDWGTTYNVTSGAYTGITEAIYVVPNAWTTHLSILPGANNTLLAWQRDDYVQPGVEDHVWPQQTFRH